MEFITENETKRISLKKLCKMVDKYNNEFNYVDIKKLIDKMMTWDMTDHVLFHMYFFKKKSIREISEHFMVSKYFVNKSIKNKIKEISSDNDILKK